LKYQKGISYLAYLLASSQLVFAYNFFATLARGPAAADNPWQVGTLEWTCAATPPAPHNYDAIPTVLHGPHEFSHPALVDKDWLGQTEPLPAEKAS
jgi:cytochrome c oxidase subunit 1